jgi:L-seryl-tRNA(Ser) seleniumtransferase
MTQAELYRELPGVDELLREPAIALLVTQAGQSAVAEACRTVLDNLRREIAAGGLDANTLALALANAAGAIGAELRRALSYSLRPLINATGVILHTNLGRAPLAQAAIDHIRKTGTAYSNLEFDLSTGERGRRDVHVDRLLQRLLAEGDAELRPAGPFDSAPGRLAVSTIVVNNNAAAVLLALNTLAEGGEVIVSRGELVEIGGSFRIPDVMGKSGAILCEVGTTNRTRIVDYERAINERTRLLLRVHRSNFEITGFTEQPELHELAALAQKHKLPLMEDLGSGALFDLRSVGINKEPGVLDGLRTGVHIVTYSGDKLLGGPQAGLISGREDLVKSMRSNSLFRALRVDKLTYAALEATLLAYVKRDYGAVPVLRMIELKKSDVAVRAEKLRSLLKATSMKVEIIDGESLVGGGSAPSATLPTALLAVTCQKLTANDLAARLRGSHPPVVARVDDGRVLLDLRTVFAYQDEVLGQVLAAAAAA